MRLPIACHWSRSAVLGQVKYVIYVVTKIIPNCNVVETIPMTFHDVSQRRIQPPMSNKINRSIGSHYTSGTYSTDGAAIVSAMGNQFFVYKAIIIAKEHPLVGTL